MGELVDRVVRKNINNESTLPLTISAQYGLVDQITYFNNRVASRDVSNYYLVLNGEFAYNKSTSDGYPFGAVKRLDLYEKGVLSTLYIVFAPKKEQQIDSDYLTVFFDTDRWHKGVAERAAEGARNHGLLNISAEDFFDIDLSVPKDIVEQKQIGAFIRQLDNLITLHQRQPFLHSTPEISLSVQLIHPFYTSSWEQRKLGELALFNPKDELPQTFEYVDLESVVGTEMLSHRTEAKSSAPSRAQRLAHTGDLFYQTVRPYQKNNYLFEKLDNNYVFSTGYAQMRPYVDGYFLLSLVQSDRFVKVVLDNCTGTSYPAINANDLAEIEVTAPPDENEAQKIGTIFRNLDNLITLHQRKFEKLTNVKKSMLEKMFPQNGSSYPEIRFKGFTDPWEQRKVGDLLIERNQQAPMSDEYPLMAFIANEGVAPKGERYDRSALVTDTVNKLYKKTEKGDFIYSSNNLETGSIGLNKYGKACISPVYSIFEPTGIADSDFLGRRLVRKDFINAMVKWRQGVIYGQWRIHESDFLKIEIPVPSVEEQRKIGAYLDQLDNLITLHQRELEKLQNIKKSMLEKMFV